MHSNRSLQNTSEVDSMDLTPFHGNQPKFIPHIGNQTLCKENHKIFVLSLQK